MLTELLLVSSLVTQNVGPGYVGQPTYSNISPFYICLNDPSSYVNIRSSPTTRSKKIGKLHFGDSVSIINRIAGPHDGMWWAYIRTYNGNKGFVRDDYVCVR